MVLDQNLTAYLEARPEELRSKKEQGIKIVGYFPGGYVPEEIIYASGAVPVCLLEGGRLDSAEAALSVVPNVICPFVRAQIGERKLGDNPYYSLIDMLVAPTTCQHIKKVTEIWEYYGDIEIFKLGVPHNFTGEMELQYFTERLRDLKERLQSLTQCEITPDRLGESVSLYNKLRELFRRISLTRQSANPTISAGDFIRLNHASFYADPLFMVTVLESVCQNLRKANLENEADQPRLLLIAPNLAHSDYKLLDQVGDAGGRIVIEEVCEGVRNYWQNIVDDDDLILSIAKGYLQDKLPCAFMRNSAQKRLDFALKLISDFAVSGVIWYNLLHCETYDEESYFFSKRLEELNIPILVLESDYGMSDISQLRIRIDAFIEMVKGGQFHE